MVALVRRAQSGEFVGIPGPVKGAGVHDGSAHRVGMAVHILGGGVGDNIGPIFERPAVDRRGKGVVHDEGHAVGVCCRGKLLKIQHGQGGVGNRLAEYRLGVGPESGLQLLGRAVGLHKGKLNAHALHGHCKQIVCSAIDGRRGDHMVSAGTDVEDCVEVGGLSRRSEHRGAPPFQCTDLCCHTVIGGILKPGIEVPAGLQIKQLSHSLARLIAEGSGLNDGDIAGFSVSGAVSRMDALGIGTLLAHIGSSFLWRGWLAQSCLI